MPHIDFASAELLWRVLAPHRLAVLRAMAGAAAWLCAKSRDALAAM